MLTAAGQAEADRALRDYWRGRLPWIDIKSVAFTFDDAHRVMRLTMDGSATMDWANDGGVRDFQIADSSLGFEASFKREPGVHGDPSFAKKSRAIEQVDRDPHLAEGRRRVRARRGRRRRSDGRGREISAPHAN